MTGIEIGIAAVVVLVTLIGLGMPIGIVVRSRNDRTGSS
jgi:hypothetical protein